MAEYTVKSNSHFGCHYCGAKSYSTIVNSNGHVVMTFERAGLAEEICTALNEAFAAGRKSMAKDVVG